MPIARPPSDPGSASQCGAAGRLAKTATCGAGAGAGAPAGGPTAHPYRGTDVPRTGNTAAQCTKSARRTARRARYSSLRSGGEYEASTLHADAYTARYSRTVTGEARAPSNCGRPRFR